MQLLLFYKVTSIYLYFPKIKRIKDFAFPTNFFSVSSWNFVLIALCDILFQSDQPSILCDNTACVQYLENKKKSFLFQKLFYQITHLTHLLVRLNRESHSCDLLLSLSRLESGLLKICIAAPRPRTVSTAVIWKSAVTGVS